MLTGMIRIEDKDVGFDAGADDYLTKPFPYSRIPGQSKVLAQTLAVSHCHAIESP